MSERTDLTTREENMAVKGTSLPTVTPLVDIFESEEEIMLYADMPGVGKEHVDVNIDNGKLEITGVRKIKTGDSGGWQEYGDVEYRRAFSVPQSIDIAKVNAELKEGVLCLHLPKAEAAKPRKIEIKAG